MTVALEHGDCRELMATLPDASVDAIVCDPPYDLTSTGASRKGGKTFDDTTPYGRARIGGFMGKAWDGTGVAFEPETWVGALRVLKPGGYLLAFGGTRTYHRMAVAIEDAGFEIRDSLMWIYGTGFPKSLNVSKAIDAHLGADREIVGDKLDRPGYHTSQPDTDARSGVLGGGRGLHTDPEARAKAAQITAPGSAQAAAHEGQGTALKPGYEPIVMARKELDGTVALNVLTHGTGALEIDGCRVDFDSEADEAESKGKNRHADFGSGPRENAVFNEDLRPRGESGNYDPDARWPANVLLTHDPACDLGEDCQPPCPVAVLNEQSGERPGRFATAGESKDDHIFAFGNARGDEPRGYGDTGGAARFFYTAKTSAAERQAGLQGFELQPGPSSDYGTKRQHPMMEEGRENKVLPTRNPHPTVKPIDLMRWLVRLVTPNGGTVLDPFMGSGSTGAAAVLEGRDFIGFDLTEEYVEIARARINWWASLPVGTDTEKALVTAGTEARHAAAGQGSLL